jgi:hypothetical protein
VTFRDGLFEPPERVRVSAFLDLAARAEPFLPETFFTLDFALRERVSKTDPLGPLDTDAFEPVRREVAGFSTRERPFVEAFFPARDGRIFAPERFRLAVTAGRDGGSSSKSIPKMSDRPLASRISPFVSPVTSPSEPPALTWATRSVGSTSRSTNSISGA